MFATIYLPNFYLQAALRHQPELSDIPVAVIDNHDSKPVFLQINRAAENAGVRCGMTPSQGLARCLHLVVKNRLLAQENLLGDLLLQFGFSLAPYVEATAPGICTIEFTERRDVRSKVQNVIAQLHESELHAQAGIAPTADISFLAAHLAQPVLEIENIHDFLAPLPIETLAPAAY
jgi:nucleotidyltransferase/DNA polymerase involved in DNA repair